jgi:serine/threonine-protein kinase
MTLTTASGLVDALRQHRILDPAQLTEIEQTLQGRFPDPRALARELMQRGWLTPYQANLLLQGRGGELVLGPYLLLERRGEGGMGQVFKARHLLMNRTVAIKVIRKERLARPDAVQRFQREIRMAAQLDHPHLIRAHDAACVGDTHFLVMEYVEGTDLQRMVQQSGRLPVAQACGYIRQAALGLQHAHERGLVHRDVKPSNVQVTANGTVVKVLDIGLARSMGPGDNDGGTGPELTHDRMIMGTPDYMAPEQIDDPRRVDARADIYSLGCTFYFLLAGRPPFGEGSWEEKLVCHRKAEPIPIEQIRPDVPAAVGAILRKMMAKRPEDRYASPAAVAEALAPFGAAGPIPVAAVAVPATPGSLIDPAPAPVPGWTLQADSTLGPAPPQAVPVPAAIPLSGATDMAPAPAQPAPVLASWSVIPGPSLPEARKRPWLVPVAAAAAVALLVALASVFWPKSDTSKTAVATQPQPGATAPSDKSEGKSPPKEAGPTVLIDENFSKPPEGGILPAGWKGDDFGVVTDAERRSCLEVNKKNGDCFVSLPPLPLGSHFYVEGEFQIHAAWSGGVAAQQLTIRLEGPKATEPLAIVIASYPPGHVSIGGGQSRPASSYKREEINRFRLVREDRALRFSLNNQQAASTSVGATTEYDTVSLGLTAGAAGRGGDKLARIYSIKVGTLPK